MCILEMDVLRNQPKVKDAVSSDVGRFLNRILGLGVARQQLVSLNIRIFSNSNFPTYIYSDVSNYA